MCKRRRRLPIVMLAALVLVAVVAPDAAAQTISDLVVSEVENGPRVLRFGEAARSLWVRFDYEGASSTTLQVQLVSAEGVSMFSREDEFSDGGRVSWQITGDEMARTLAGRGVDAAETAQENARRAANQSRGVPEYLATASFGVAQMQRALKLLAQMELPAGAGAHLDDGRAAADAFEALLVQAARLPPNDIPGRQELAAQMAAPAARAVAATRSLRDDVASAAGLPLPPTRSGAGERDAHTVSLRVNGSPSASASIWVFDGRVFLPWTGKLTPR